ncbi:MAG TPA: sensor histidine kinase [Spirochaetia bacterium]|nr:sensor histidine kinase [Spirochaetia bacterium]
MSLKNRLLCFFLIISILPVLLLGTLSYSLSYRIMRNGEINKQLQDLEHIKTETRELMYRFQHVGIRFLLDRNLQSLLLTDDRSYAGLTRFGFEIKKLLHDYRNTSGTISSGLLFQDGLLFENRPEKFPDFGTYTAKPWFEKSMREGRSYFWGDPMSIGNDLAVPLVRILPSLVDDTRSAVLVINVQESTFSQIREDKKTPTDVVDFIVNERGVIVSHTRKSFVGLGLEAAYGIGMNDFPGESGSLEEKTGEGMGLFVYTADPKTSWTYFRLLPVARVTASIRYIPNSTLCLSLGCLLIGFILSFLLSHQILSPVKRLIETVKKQEDGLIRIDERKEARDEISFLNESFEAIMRKLTSAIEESLAMQNEKREAEIKMLEYQINPHFLYNTLSTIVWLAHAQKYEDIIQVTDALSDFLRISMGKGKEFIQVKDEIRHIERFIEIEKKRYPGKFAFYSELDPQIATCYTIKLILQPLVENAIQHGVAMRKDNAGIITVVARGEEDTVLFEVIDNGPESVKEKVPQILSILAHDGTGGSEWGIGLLNVNKRIKLHYGSEYGISFSRRDGRTFVSLRIPRLYDEGSYA